MKKIFLAALLAAGSFNAFGAACADGSIQVQINAVSCTINGWTLDTWGLSPAATANGYNAVPIADNIFVSFNALGGPTPGFSVTFSNNGLANNGFFTAVPGTPNQSANFNTNFSILGAPIVDVYLGVNDATVNSPSLSGQISVQKIVYNPLAPPPGNPSLGDNNILTTHSGQTSPNPINVLNNPSNALGRVSVADIYQITAGNNGTGSTLTSFTNYFYGETPQTGVPEPMSFVLMGAGLVGIAALRRRNG